MSSDRAKRAAIERRKAALTKVALALPGVVQDDLGDHIGYSLRAKRFAWILDNHHGDDRVALNAKGERGTNSALVEAHPDRFHMPKYVGKQGWIGLWLDLPDCDLAEAGELIRDAWRLAAPKRLMREEAPAPNDASRTTRSAAKRGTGRRAPKRHA